LLLKQRLNSKPDLGSMSIVVTVSEDLFTTGGFHPLLVLSPFAGVPVAVRKRRGAFRIRWKITKKGAVSVAEEESASRPRALASAFLPSWLASREASGYPSAFWSWEWYGEGGKETAFGSGLWHGGK
jgi:hypothetical protein